MKVEMNDGETVEKGLKKGNVCAVSSFRGRRVGIWSERMSLFRPVAW